jgi:hypothetical protein
LSEWGELGVAVEIITGSNVGATIGKQKGAVMASSREDAKQS